MEPSTSKFNLPRMNIHPPTAPVALGTFLYPKEILDRSSSHPIPTQFRMISINRQANEIQMFENNKDEDWKTIRRNNAHIAKYCDICSEFSNDKQKVIQHAHISSLKHRMEARLDYWGQYLCITCKQGVHNVKAGTRYPILVTSSTLNNWQGTRSMNGYEGDPIHIDVIAIPGACIAELTHAFKAEYGKMYRPVDILLVSGLNNVMSGQGPEEVMKEILIFKREVLATPGSSFAVATLLMPPSLTKLTKETEADLKQDQTTTIVKLNYMIRDLNSEGKSTVEVHRAPTFHTWGLKSTNLSKLKHPRNFMEGLQSHDPLAWREKNRKKQLHLSDSERLRMGRAVVKYFMAIYGLLESNTPRK